MASTNIDTTIKRVEMDGFPFPLGVYPVETMSPKPGHTVDFEPADGGGAASDWEEWPDRYMYDIVTPANRLRSLCRALFSLLPMRVYPILDLLGEDIYREVDPYIAYDPTPFDRFIELVHKHQDWLYEDGLVGFGAMSEDPFLYIYIDEHKIVTVRVNAAMREQIERIIDAFDIPQTESLQGADAAAHEHRSVLSSAPEGITEEEILEELIESWRLQLNVDRDSNVDDVGKELGITSWRCLIRLAQSHNDPPVYAQVWLRASSLVEAERLAIDAATESAQTPLDSDAAGALVVIADRISQETLLEALAGAQLPSIEDDDNVVGVLAVRLVTDAQPPPGS